MSFCIFKQQRHRGTEHRIPPHRQCFNVSSKAMTTLRNFLILFSIASFSFFAKACGQNKAETKTDRNSKKVNDIQTLINSTFPLIEDLLKKHGEFYPLASAIEPNDSIVMVATYNGDDKPRSQNVIDDLKAALKQGASEGKHKVVAIFSDVKTIDPNTQQKTDAVAIHVEHKDGSAYIFYYPYQINANKELTISKSFGNSIKTEIF